MASKAYVAAVFAAHATCSISMVLLNKTIAEGFDFPWTVLFVQNVGTVLIGYLYTWCGECSRRSDGARAGSGSADLEAGSMAASRRRRLFGLPVPRAFKNQLWLVLQVAFFMGMLFTSLRALKFISVPLYVVARNTVPAQTALIERVFTNVKLPIVSVVGLMGTIVGAVLYTYGDLHAGLDRTGLMYAVLLTGIVSSASVVDKTAVRTLGQEEDIKPVECSQLRSALSLPVNLAFILLFEMQDIVAAGDLAPPSRPDIYAATMQMSLAVSLSIFLSTIFGTGVGIFNFCLQQVVNAATVQVANILYKLTTTIISRMTHPSPVAMTSWLGFCVSLMGIGLYTFGPQIVSAMWHRSDATA